MGRRVVRVWGAAAVLLWMLVGPVSATELRVGFIPVLGVAQLFVIEGEGWDQKAGFEIVPTQFESGPAMISALASGTLDAAYSGIGPMMVAQTRGLDVRVVAACATGEVAVVARGRLAGLSGGNVAAALAAFKAMEGRPARIASQPAGSMPDTVLRYWLETVAKADPTTYDILGMGIEQTQQALLAGAVDAASVREPTVTLVLMRDPEAKVLAVEYKDEAQEWAEENADELRGHVQAHPLTSLLIAGGVGALLGAIFLRR